MPSVYHCRGLLLSRCRTLSVFCLSISPLFCMSPCETTLLSGILTGALSVMSSANLMTVSSVTIGNDVKQDRPHERPVQYHACHWPPARELSINHDPLCQIIKKLSSRFIIHSSILQYLSLGDEVLLKLR